MPALARMEVWPDHRDAFTGMQVKCNILQCNPTIVTDRKFMGLKDGCIGVVMDMCIKRGMGWSYHYKASTIAVTSYFIISI